MVDKKDTSQTVTRALENKGALWYDISSHLKIMRLTAVDCYVILDALSHSLNVLNYGNTTKESRERVLRKIESIMYHMNVEIITDTSYVPPDVVELADERLFDYERSVRND